MTVQSLTRPTITISDELRAEAADVVEQVGDERVTGVTITTATGKTIELPSGLAQVLDSLVHRMEQGGRVVLESMPELLTTSAAADVLGVSRPTLIKLIDDDKLPAVMRGTHRRVPWAALSTYRHVREAERAAAVAELLAADFGGE